MDEHQEFIVVVNHEEQYAIWPSFKPLPNGWRKGGHQGDKASCLEFIENSWTDMRPLSIRTSDRAQDDK